MRFARFALCAFLLALSYSASAEATFPGANGRIAYECGSEICLTNAAGSFKKRLTEPARKRRFRFAPSFSPDGKGIVFAGEAREGRLELYLIRSNGTGLRRITHSARRMKNSVPQFTPDGQGVTFFRKGGVFALDLSTRKITRLGPGLGETFIAVHDIGSDEYQLVRKVDREPTSVGAPVRELGALDEKHRIRPSLS